MAAPRFSKVEKDAMLAAYLAGEKVREIARQFHCDKTYPSILAKRRRKARNRNERRDRALAAYQAGEKIEVIAALTGYAVDYIRELARRRGIPARVRPPRC